MMHIINITFLYFLHICIFSFTLYPARSAAGLAEETSVKALRSHSPPTSGSIACVRDGTQRRAFTSFYSEDVTH